MKPKNYFPKEDKQLILVVVFAAIIGIVASILVLTY